MGSRRIVLRRSVSKDLDRDGKKDEQRTRLDLINRSGSQAAEGAGILGSEFEFPRGLSPGVPGMYKDDSVNCAILALR